MATDGVISEEEKGKLAEIGDGLEVEMTDAFREEISDFCILLAAKTNMDTEGTAVKDKLDKILSERTDDVENGIMPRHLLWNMLVIAGIDGEYSDSERVLIHHTAEVLGVEKNVLSEMEMMLKSAEASEKELDILRVSTKPYVEVRPYVDEAEERLKRIAEAAKALIQDDVVREIRDEGEREEPVDRSNFFADAGNKISDTASTVGGAVGGAVSGAASWVSSGVTGLLKKK
ncbi:MAG: hypothetical protein IK016_04550 [Lachnospiraceae bacterium]|nr:hypothetical protein [Lachnospiraceae bacterium]